MPQNLKKQTIQLIQSSSNILIVFKDCADCSDYPKGADASFSAIALKKILLKNNKHTDIASPKFPMFRALQNFAQNQEIKTEIKTAGKARLSIDIKKSGMADFSYEVDGNKLNIFLTPKNNSINLSSISSEQGLYQYDLIIAIDTPEIASLGSLYYDNEEFFAFVPIINIAHDAENSLYGEINLLNLKASSCSEIIFGLLENSKNMDSEIAKLLLSGMIAKTKNFKNHKITHNSLLAVNSLIELGADKQQITDQLYKTKDIANFKIWGRALARLKKEGELMYSLLTANDFTHCGADENMLTDVIDELLSHSSKCEHLAIIYENENHELKGLFYSNIGLAINKLDLELLPNKSKTIFLSYKNLVEAEKELLSTFKKIN